MKFRKRPLFLLLLCFILALGALIFFGEKGILHRLRLERDLARIREANRQLSEENERLKEEVKRLQTDRTSIEEIARKELGLVKDDELIYQFDSTEGHGESSR